MVRAASLLSLLVVGSLGVASPAQAFWCHGRLVLEGDRMHEVRANCGEPASQITRMEESTFYAGGARRAADGSFYGGSARTVSVQIDIWVYDFGPTRFMEELRFEDGVLRRLTALGRGTRRSEISPLAPPTARFAANDVALPLRRGALMG